MVLVGDLNIAPLETDVWSHRQLLDVVSHTPVETEGLNRLQAAYGFVDAVRAVVPPARKLYTWWSYRNRDWAAPTAAGGSTMSGSRRRWRPTWSRRRCGARRAAGTTPATTCR